MHLLFTPVYLLDLFWNPSQVAGRGIFSLCKAEDESGLTPGEDDNAAGRKKNRPDTAQGFQNRSIAWQGVCIHKQKPPARKTYGWQRAE